VRRPNCVRDVRCCLKLTLPMVKRATRSPSRLFHKVLTQAEQRLALDSEQAANLEHKGIRGNERAAALAEFLSLHLPGVFAIGKGESRDYGDRVTGELDLLIFDRSTAAPIQTGSDSVIIPAEALYAVIEVKSVLSQNELDACLRAAVRVRSLRPFKKRFIASPTDGRVEKEHYRCPYFIFAYTSNLGQEGWAKKEYQRVIDRASGSGCAPDLVDWIIVLSRGIIRPQVGAALLKGDSPSLFLEFYLHLVNFLMRERRRRPPIDWTAYTANSRWTRVT
jgi:hypothetical protein